MFFVGKKARLQNTHYLHRSQCEILPDIHARITLEATKIEQALVEAQNYFDVVKPCALCILQKQTASPSRKAAL